MNILKSRKSFKNIVLIALVLMLSFCMASCGSDSKDEDAGNPPAQSGDTSTATGNAPVARIEMEDGGIIEVQLDPAEAPLSVENFVKLAKEGFYDGLIFHRVISGFMIQGGGYDPDMAKMDAPTVKGEFKANDVENNLSHARGIISMARIDGQNDSASSQFFIVHEDSPFLDGNYAAFGEVISGMDVVDRIAEVATDNAGLPAKPIVIKTITIQ